MRFLLPAAAALLLAAPSVGQEVTPTMGDDLDCAIFVAITIDSVSTEEDPDAAMGLAAGLTYFIGRYEGQGGSDIEADLLARFKTMTLEDMAGLEGKCGPQLEAMGERLQTAGRAFIAAGEGEAEAGDTATETADEPTEQ